MQIRKFSIKNYRSLKDISINEFNSTTIFYGDNNAGKSNVLNALELLFKRKQTLDAGALTEAQNFYIGNIPDSKNNFYNNETANPITFSVEIDIDISELTISEIISKIFPKKGTYTFSFSGSISFIEGVGDYSEIKFEEISANKIIIYSSKDTKVEYFPTLRTQKDVGALANAFNKLINAFNDCVYIIGSDRDMHEVSIKEDNISLISPSTFKKFLYDLYLSPQGFYLFEEINEVFSKPPFSYGTISFSQEAGDRLQLMIKESGFRLPIKHLGSGVLQSLYIISCIIYSKSKIVCIEELEQNLSPRKQYEILKKIQSMILDPKRALNQLIISTHSAVYFKPKLGTIYFLVKEDGKTNVKNPIKKSSKSTGAAKGKATKGTASTKAPVVTKFAKKSSKEEAELEALDEISVDDDFKEHLAPNSSDWTDDDIDDLLKDLHDFPPFERAKK